MYQYYIMPKNTKKVKFNINLIPSRRIYKTRRLLGGMENEDFYKKNNDHFYLKEYKKKSNKDASKKLENDAKKRYQKMYRLSQMNNDDISDIERQFSSLSLNNKKRKELKGTTPKQRKTKTQRRRPKTLDDIEIANVESSFSSLLLNDKKRKSKTQRRRAKSFGGMESLTTIDYELPLKANKSLSPSSLPPRPNRIQTQKTLLKTQIQLEKAKRKQELKNYIDANKNLLAKTDLRVTDNDWVKGIHLLIDLDDSVPELQTHLDLNYEDVKNIFLNKK